MNSFFIVLLMLNLVLTSFVLLKMKTRADKMTITLLFGTTGVGILFLLYAQSKQNSFLDLALVIVLLSSVSAIVFAKRLRYMERDDG
jgi:multisubunit Na+/H+ antiporter MnhF subunit